MIKGISADTAVSIPRQGSTSTIVTDTKQSVTIKEKFTSKEHTPMTDNLMTDTQIKEKLIETTAAMNNFLKPMHTSLKFELHDELKDYYISIVDDTTGDVIKELPSKKLLDMYAAMAENMALFVDRKI